MVTALKFGFITLGDSWKLVLCSLSPWGCCGHLTNWLKASDKKSCVASLEGTNVLSNPKGFQKEGVLVYMWLHSFFISPTSYEVEDSLNEWWSFVWLSLP